MQPLQSTSSLTALPMVITTKISAYLIDNAEISPTTLKANGDFVRFCLTGKHFTKLLPLFKNAISLVNHQTPTNSSDERIFTGTLLRSARTLDLSKFIGADNLTPTLSTLNSKFPNLTHLDMPQCTLTDEVGEKLSLFPHLKSLDIALCLKENPEGLRHLKLTQLLNFRHGSIDACMTHEERAESYGKLMSSIPDGMPDNILEMLHLSDTTLAKIAEHQPKLQILNDGFSGDPRLLGVQGLASLAKLTSLEELSTTSLQLTAQQLASLETLSQLKRLSLADELFLDSSAITIIASQFPLLEQLSGSFDLTEKEVAPLAMLTNLHTLNITIRSDCDGVLRALASLTNLKKLCIKIDTGEISEQGIRTLAAASHLQTLKLFYRSLTDLHIDILKDQLPDCRLILEGFRSYVNKQKC